MQYHNHQTHRPSSTKACVALLFPALIVARSLNAADTEPSFPKWKGAAELGSIRTTGNTNTSSINATLNLKRKARVWDLVLNLDALTSKEDDVTSKERYKGTLDLNRKFTRHHYLATTLSYEFDRFSGYDYQTLYSIGYGYRLINNRRHYLDAEIGPGYRYDQREDNSGAEEETVLRLAGKYFWKIQKGVEFDQMLSVNTGSQKTTWRSESSLKSRINGSLATRISYHWDYTDTVPSDSKHTNSEFGVTLVYNF